MPNLHRLFASLGIAALLCVLFVAAGCEAKHPKNTQQAIEIFTKKVDKVAGMLRTIKTKADAEEISPRINTLGDELEVLADEAKALPMPEASEKEGIKNASDVATDAVKLFVAQVKRVHDTVPEADTAIRDSLLHFNTMMAKFSFDADPNFKALEHSLPARPAMPQPPQMPQVPQPPTIDRRSFQEKLPEFKAKYPGPVVVIEITGLPMDGDIGALSAALKSEVSATATTATRNGTTGGIALVTPMPADQVAGKITFGTHTVNATTGVITVVADPAQVPRLKK